MMKLITAYIDQIMFLIVETPYFPFFTSLLVCILVIFWKRFRARGLKSPPGPWKLPVIGNLHRMVGPLPHHTLRGLAKKHGPIMHLKLGQLEAVIISSAEAAQEVLKTHELTFAERPMVLAAEVISFVDVLLKLKESKKAEFNFTTNQIKDIIMDIFSAGSETSATTMEWAMSELMRNPRVMKRAQAEVRQLVVQFEGKKSKGIEEREVQKMDYLKSVVKEALRLPAPGHLLTRETRDTVQIGGFKVPVKSKVIINAWAIGREPGADAECFKPERFHGSSVDFKGFDFEFIPLGAGRRMCPGISFGVTMIELALAELLYRFDWKLANGMNPDELYMMESFGLGFRRKNALFLIATPHFTSLGES